MSNSLIIVQKPSVAVTIIKLNRPLKRNALNIQLMDEMCAAIEHAALEPQSRVIIFIGEGPVFCSGLDLEEARDASKEQQSTSCVAHLLQTVTSCPLVTIAAVHGAAIAGGAGLMSACDLAIVANDARLAYPEVRRGMIPAQVMTLLLRQLGQKEIKELVLLGESINPERALMMGLINRIVHPNHLLDEALKMAESVCQGAPKAIAMTKELINRLYPTTFQSDLAKAIEYHHASRRSEEAQEGFKAFLEKRKPNWTFK